MNRNSAVVSTSLGLLLVAALFTAVRGDSPSGHGIRDFNAGAHLFVVPNGVNTVEIEAWGGGGGSGACNTGAAGSGGGGGYVHGVVAVLPNRAYDVVVGSGGAGGVFDVQLDGSPGGTTAFGIGGSALIAAFGGGGGVGLITTPGIPGSGGCGPGGAGGGGNPAGGIVVPGTSGGRGGGTPGASLLGNRLPPASAGGRGGGLDGQPGSPGYMVVKW